MLHPKPDQSKSTLSLGTPKGCEELHVPWDMHSQ